MPFPSVKIRVMIKIGKLLTIKRILVAAVLLLVASFFVGWNYVQKTPQYSLYSLYKAVEARDYDTFTKYVDVDSVIDDLITKGLAENKSESGDEWAALGESLATLFLPMVKERAKTQIRSQIEEGTFGVLNGNDLSSPIKALTKIKVEINGKIADVSYTRAEGGTIAVKMRSKDDYWQISSVDPSVFEDVDLWGDDSSQ